MNIVEFMRKTLVLVGVIVLLVAFLGAYLPVYASEIKLGCYSAMALMIITGLPWHTPYTARPANATAVVMLSMGVRIVGTTLIFVLVKRQGELAIAPVMMAFIGCVLPLVLIEAALIWRRLTRGEETVRE